MNVVDAPVSLVWLQRLLDASLHGMIVYEAVCADEHPSTITDLRPVLVNEAARAAIPLPEDNWLGQTLRHAWPQVAATPFYNQLVSVLDTGISCRFVYPLDHLAQPRWFEVLATCMGSYGVLSYADVTEQYRPVPTAAQQSYTDSTAIKEAELAQRQHGEVLNSLLAAAPVAFAQYKALRDEQGKIIDFTCVNANQAAADALQYPLHQLIGLSMTVINPTVKSSFAFAHYLRVTTTGEPINYVRQLGVQWFHVSLVQFQDGFVSASIDVTESRLQQQQLEAANSELLHANDNLQQFVYVASHDLQEPLRKIQSFGDLIGERYAPELGTFGLDALHRMQSAAGRMSLLINDLLIYSRISTQRRPFRPIDLEQVLLDVLADLDPRFTETGAVLEHDPLPVVAGDASQLRQLFHNLLTNALKFQPLNQPDHRPKLEIRCQRTETDGRAWYELRFTDNGIGFEPKYIDRIFQVFQRLHTKQVYDGTGVGLAICYRVADSHGGTISADSQPGQGATFLVRLPA